MHPSGKIQQNNKAEIYKYKTSNRLINIDKNTHCPISYEPFVEGQGYYLCSVCKYQFGTILNTHLKSTSKCPMCASKWEDSTK